MAVSATIGAHAGNGLKSAHAVTQVTGHLSERQVECADLGSGLAPHGVVVLHVIGEVLWYELGAQQTGPVSVGAEAPTTTGLAAGAAEESFHRIDLCDLDPHEVASTG